ncbi:MAG: hypothetical protein KJO35_02285 [Gammaproteobacteria bacterium]|nr:hypothetical protein [Gammaproteobacteria bacterium]
MSDEKNLIQRFIGLPTTRLGIWSVSLGIAFLLLFSAWLFYVTVRQVSRPTFFSDPVHAILILSAAASGIGGAIAGTLAVLLRQEHSWIVLLSVLQGSVVFIWTVAEIIGH